MYSHPPGGFPQAPVGVQDFKMGIIKKIIMVFAIGALCVAMICGKILLANYYPRATFFISIAGLCCLFLALLLSYKRSKILCIIIFCLFVGGVFNTLAVATNSYRMPVQVTERSFYDFGCRIDSMHICFFNKSEVNYYFFVDRFPTEVLIYSVGDVIIFFSSIVGCIFISSVITIRVFKKKPPKPNYKF